MNVSLLLFFERQTHIDHVPDDQLAKIGGWGQRLS